eukprot:2713337-Rhodomonas_salina.4
MGKVVQVEECGGPRWVGWRKHTQTAAQQRSEQALQGARNKPAAARWKLTGLRLIVAQGSRTASRGSIAAWRRTAGAARRCEGKGT